MKRAEIDGIYERAVKRVLDIFFACVFLIVLSPLFLILALAVRFALGAPVVFRQRRGGRDGKIFNIFKFRTMTDERDSGGRPLSDEERLTAFGRWLRASSLDELPQLVNILRGEMSFVGPRPQDALFLPDYTDEELRRHKVRPGLTGLAQVSGRNALRWRERFELDCKYADNLSFVLDLKIIFLTFNAVLGKHRGGEANVESFYDREKL